MRFGELKYLINEQKRLPVWQHVHDLNNIIQWRRIGIIDLNMFFTLFFPDLGFDLLCKCNISCMPGSGGHDMPLQRNSNQGQIAYHIQKFMTGRLILITKLYIIQDSLFGNINIIAVKKYCKVL